MAAGSLLRKFWSGGPVRKSRLHDELGARVSLPRLIRNGPRAVATGLARLAFGQRPPLPWISYDAQARLNALLGPQHRVLEFGSGMSTLWFAQRAGSVVSIEDDQAWFDRVAPQLRAVGTVDRRFAEGRAGYVAAAGNEPFDLIVIDGNWRDDCARFATRHLNEGGVIYLDNSDKAASVPTGDVPFARAILLEFALQHGLAAEEFIDFAPTQLFVQRGLLIGGGSRVTRVV